MIPVAIQVPLKARPSQRIPGKNFREIGGKPLCFWLLDRLATLAPEQWRIFIDSEDDAVWRGLSPEHKNRFAYYQRDRAYAEDWSNGNHLLHHFASHGPEAEVYAQVFVTAPFLRPQTIAAAIDALEASPRHDSLVAVTQESGWVWMDGRPVNYEPSRMDGLPRSQDRPWFKETTGLYLVRRQALLETGCRVGRTPLLFEIPRDEAQDIDTPEDWEAAKLRLLEPWQERSLTSA